MAGSDPTSDSRPNWWPGAGWPLYQLAFWSQGWRQPANQASSSQPQRRLQSEGAREKKRRCDNTLQLILPSMRKKSYHTMRMRDIQGPGPEVLPHAPQNNTVESRTGSRIILLRGTPNLFAFSVQFTRGISWFPSPSPPPHSTRLNWMPPVSEGRFRCKKTPRDLRRHSVLVSWWNLSVLDHRRQLRWIAMADRTLAPRERKSYSERPRFATSSLFTSIMIQCNTIPQPHNIGRHDRGHSRQTRHHGPHGRPNHRRWLLE